MKHTLIATVIAVLAVTATHAQSPLIVPLFMSDGSTQQGFARIVNHSYRAGTVRIYGTDDSGAQFGPITLFLNARQTRHFNSRDLEVGNQSKGLSGSLGNGTGHWRLRLETDLDIEPAAYIRTPDGFLSSVHDVVRTADLGNGTEHLVSFFNPGANRNQRSWLRLVNLTDDSVGVTIQGRDDMAQAASGGEVRLTLSAGEARRITAQQLESGAAGFTGRLGHGSGKWQLSVTADDSILVMSLLQSPTGHLTNLSTSLGASGEANTGPELVPASKRAVQAIPRLGSVTQSSNIDPATKVTLDVVDVVLDEMTGAVTVHNRRGDSVRIRILGAGTDAGRYVPEQSEAFDKPIEFLGVAIHGSRVYHDPDPPEGTGSQLIDYLNEAGEVVFRDYDNGFIPEEERIEGGSPCHPNAGRCYVMLTNRRALGVEGSADSAPRFDPGHLDYWVLGDWMSPQGAEPPEFGAFAVPSSPLTTEQLESISRPVTPNTAEYRGIELSRFINEKTGDSEGALEDLPSEVLLTVTFGSTQSPQIGGEIVFESENPAFGPGGWARETIILEDAAIDTSSSGGFFRNTTSYRYAEGNTADGTIYETSTRSETGHWGGQFFGGLDAGDGNLPNSVTGTYSIEMDRGAGRDVLRALGTFVGLKQ